MSSLRPNPNVVQFPSPTANANALARAVQALKQSVDSLGGYRGSVLDRAVTYRDLVSLGLLTQSGANTTPALAGSSSSSVGSTTVVNPYVVSGFSGASPLDAGQVVLAHQFPSQVVFPANFGAIGIAMSSLANAFVPPAGGAAISIQRCPAASDPTVAGHWTEVGSASLASGAHAAALATAGAAQVIFSAGDFMRWVWPGDPMLAQFLMALVGTR